MSNTNPLISWQATPLDGEYWQVVTHKGETLAIIVEAVTQSQMSAQQTARIMADAPQLLHALKHAHHCLNTVFMALLDPQNVDIDALKRANNQVNERLSLLSNHREFIANKECGHE